MMIASPHTGARVQRQSIYSANVAYGRVADRSTLRAAVAGEEPAAAAAFCPTWRSPLPRNDRSPQPLNHGMTGCEAAHAFMREASGKPERCP